MRRSTQWFAALAVVASVMAPCGVSGQAPSSDKDGRSEFRGLSAADAQSLRRRVEQTVREAGVVESAAVIELYNQVPGESLVVSIVRNGSNVREGDLLLQLDDSRLQDELLKQQLAEKQAQADVVSAASDVQRAKREAEAVIPAARIRLKTSELARSRYLDEGGELEYELASADRRAALAQQRIQTAQRQLAAGEGSDRQPSPLDVKLVLSEARDELEAAQARKQLLTRHVREHETALRELAIAEAKAALQQAEANGVAATESAQAHLRTREARLELEQKRLETIQQQIEACRLIAPHDGVVLHGVPSSGRRSAASGLEPGMTVVERQLLLKMPDLEHVQVRVSVHESQVNRVRAGQALTLHFDALPNRELTGEVIQVNRTPEPSQWFARDVVEYGVLVAIKEPPKELKLGMSALAEIHVGPLDQQE